MVSRTGSRANNHDLERGRAFETPDQAYVFRPVSYNWPGRAQARQMDLLYGNEKEGEGVEATTPMPHGPKRWGLIRHSSAGKDIWRT